LPFDLFDEIEDESSLMVGVVGRVSRMGETNEPVMIGGLK